MREHVVITGASSGIGQALAIYFANLGCDVIAIARNEIFLQRIKLLAVKGSVNVIVADLEKEKDLDKVVKFFKSEDRIKYLVHCAATTEPHKPLTAITRSELEKSININVMAPIFLTQKLVPYFNMAKTRVLFMGSDYVGSSNKIRPGITGAYGISKSAVRVVVEYFRHEYKGLVLIGYLNPGATNTPMLETIKTAVLTRHGIFNAGQPADPNCIAEFIQAVLQHSSDTDYIATDWDYRNTEHHQLLTSERPRAIPKIRASL